MNKMMIATEAELRKLVELNHDTIACVEEAFVALADGRVTMPPILRLDIEEYRGEVDVKTAYIKGLPGFAVKISPGFFDNPKLGLPSVNGLMILFDSQTGLIRALFLDNGYLTDIRTAAAGAVAAKYLATPQAHVAAILGAGIQAQLQLEALSLVRPLTEARVWARQIERAQAMATNMSAKLGIPIRAETDVRSAVTGADLIVTTTPATQPILLREWISPGQHITAVGSDAETKNEIDPTIVILAEPYVADSLIQVRRLGELKHAIVAGLVSPSDKYPELGAVIKNIEQGRLRRDAITLCDLTGTGAQDTAIALLAHTRMTASTQLLVRDGDR